MKRKNNYNLSDFNDDSASIV